MAELRQELGLEGTYSVLYFGRPGISKGLEYLIDALPMAAREIPNLKAVLIVSGDDKERSDSMRNKIRETGMENRIVWIPGVKYVELREHLSAVDAVVVPSLVEGFGFSAAETCALGKNLVYSNAAALPEVVFGNVVPAEPANPADIARAIVDMRNGKGQDISRKTFSWDSNVEALENIYANIQ